MDDLRRTYINQHKKYFHTSYSTDVIYTGLNNGLKSLMEDAADDYSNILYKQLNIVVSAFDDMKKMLGISSYIDINVYKGVSVSLKVPDLVLEDLGSSEYSVLLYELMANDKVYKGMKDVFKENYCYNIISYAKDISGRIDELIKNDNLERLTEAKQALVKVTETLATADIRSPEFAAAYVDLEFYQNNYLDKWKMKKFITENSGTFGDMTELISSVFNEINDVSRAYQYLCWATTYAEASTMFKDIIREIGERAESRYKQLYITNGVDRTNPYSKLYMYKGLAESAKSFINVMDSYVEDAHKTFASEILGKTEDSCVNLVLNAVQEKVTGKSNVLDLIIPGLGIFNDVLSGTKLFVDVCTSADEKYKSLVAVDSLKLIADLLVDMSKNCGIVMDAGVRVPIPNNNFDILSVEYEQALRFDELINMYKTAMILACEYGIEYEKLEMKSNAVFANLVPDMWYDAGETTGWQKQVSMSAGVITTLNCSKIILSNIKCHDGTLDPLISKVIDYPDSLKIVTIACPVDVQVLDSNGNQVAYLTENNVDVVSGYEPYFFTVRTNNDDYIKTAVIPENENYQLLIKGNNRGNMTVFIAQSKNNQIVEVETFANYPVTKNTVGHIDFSDKDKPLGNLIITAGEIVDNEELYTVKFNANSGTKLSQEKRRLSMGERIGTLPTVQRKNYIFKGWYTKKSGGKRVKSTTVLDFSTTLYAHWSKVIPPKKVKLLSLESTERGIITVTFKNVLEAAGYQIAYSTASDFTSSKVKKIFSNKANKARLKPGEIYYVKIRAYKTDSAGKRVYGTYSKKKKIKVME